MRGAAGNGGPYRDNYRLLKDEVLIESRWEEGVMITPDDTRMCVADVMQDDDIENIDSIMRTLNSDAKSSWRAARGTPFTLSEVTTAVAELMAAGMVTPCAEAPRSADCVPISRDQIGRGHPIESLWFHLEESGREAVRKWWGEEGHVKLPLDQPE